MDPSQPLISFIHVLSLSLHTHRLSSFSSRSSQIHDNPSKLHLSLCFSLNMPPSTRGYTSKPVNNAKMATPKRVESNAITRNIESNSIPKRITSIVEVEGVSGKKRPHLAQDEEESEVEDASPLRHHVFFNHITIVNVRMAASNGMYIPIHWNSWRLWDWLRSRRLLNSSKPMKLPVVHTMVKVELEGWISVHSK